MTVARHVIVRGRVQGVGFRAFVEDEAIRRGLTGWVRNRRDGTVEALFRGKAEAVVGMIEACRSGPSSAHVGSIDEQDGDGMPLDQRDTFTVLPTA